MDYTVHERHQDDEFLGFQRIRSPKSITTVNLQRIKKRYGITSSEFKIVTNCKYYLRWEGGGPQFSKEMTVFRATH